MSQNICVSETDSTKFKENEITYFTELTTRNIITHTSKSQQGHVHIQSIIEQQLHQLNTDIKTMDMPTLRIVAKHLQSAISIRKAMNVNKDRRLPPLPVKRKIASNAKIEKQLHFFSTKKKRQKMATMSQPTHQDTMNSVRALTNTHPEFCGICFSIQDKEKELQIQWCQCSSCDLWVHLACAGLNLTDIQGEYVYLCQYCNQA